MPVQDALLGQLERADLRTIYREGVAPSRLPRIWRRWKKHA